jgi:DNA-3-methyladenine glycosylase II
MAEARSSGAPSRSGIAVSSRVIERRLSAIDPILGQVIRQKGPCPLKRKRGGFDIICRMIVFQQLSGKAANTIWERFRLLCPRKKPTPSAVAALSDQQLRTAGLSRQKVGYLRNLVSHVNDGSLNFSRLGAMSDHAVAEHLTQVKGIGQWTAEMYLMFVLGRPDVFSAGDLGLRTGVKKLYGARRKNLDFAKFAERWKPYRTVASWYLWRSLEK